MTETIPISEFEFYLTDLCQKEVLNAELTLEEVLAKRAVELRKKLNARSPKDTGEYAKGWRIRTATRDGKKVKVLYNAKKPFLTLILEYGTYRMKAQPHIRLALDEEVDQIMEELLSRL